MTGTPTRTVPLLDLRAQYRTIRDEVLAEVTRLFDAQQFILGRDVAMLEEEIASYCGTRFAVGCASGTDALYLALFALGVSGGDEVITVPYTFFATAGAIARAGARPVFVDIDSRTFNMDPGQLRDTLRRHPKAKAVLPVHLFGDCADMDPILEAAAEHGLPVIEDAAQAIGAEYKGRRAGSMGLLACFSFYPSKNLSGAGDGGMLTTNDESLARRLKSLRVHGSETRYYHDEVGINSRLDSIQAAVLRVKLRRLDDWTRKRQVNAELYRSLLAQPNLPIQLPTPSPHSTRHVFNQFVVRADRRDQLRKRLSERGIGSELYYPLPLHLQRCFEDLGYRQGAFPVSEECARDSLALPVFPELAALDVEYVCAEIREFYGAA